ncbi:hypothetical protein PV11_00490 [Exophiala sideris]|uniref:Uncharacterized protein n=1 Tax=Exophiala sideris TaxID=1016849 RepID=A0A0D1YTB3_9EURO|nr:hypothetical protein PV11_00490 [Exophiala sideris]
MASVNVKQPRERGYKQHLLSWRSGPSVRVRSRARNVKFHTPRKNEPGDFEPKPGVFRSKDQSTGEADHVHGQPVTPSALVKPEQFIKPFQIEYALAPALSLYIRDVSPSFHRRQYRQPEGVDGSLLQSVVPFVMTHDVVQYSCGAVTLLVQDFTRTCIPRLTPQVYQLLEKTYAALRRSIAEGRSSLDATIWGIEALVAVWNFLGEYERTAIHVKAMQDLLDAYGGYEALGFDGFLAWTVKSYFSHFKAMKIVHAETENIDPRFQTIADAKYCDQASRAMSNVPKGLRTIIANCMLTYQCISLIGTISDWDIQWRNDPLSKQVDEDRHLHVARCVNLLQTSNSAHQHDLLVSLALLSYCCYRGSEINSCWIVNCYVQICCKSLMVLNFGTCDPALVMWAARMLRAVYGSDNMSCTFSNRLMAAAVARRSSTQVPGVSDCGRFFWDDSLTNDLRASYKR